MNHKVSYRLHPKLERVCDENPGGKALQHLLGLHFDFHADFRQAFDVNIA